MASAIRLGSAAPDSMGGLVENKPTPKGVVKVPLIISFPKMENLHN